MRYLFSLALLLGCIQLSVGQVATLEYFIDRDPGFGNGVAVSITAGNDISKSFVVPLTSMEPGFHTLYARSKDVQGRWSVTVQHPFVLATIPPTILTAAEYFLDTDPGTGQGTAIAITAGNAVTQSFLIPLATVSAGYHILSIRTRDDLGNWSLVTRHVFYILSNTGTTLTGAEYFLDTDPGMGNGTAVNITNQANANATFVVPLTSVSYGFHTLFVRTRDNEGRWSLTLQKAFYTDNHTDTTKITTLQYYFTEGENTSATYTYAIPSPAAMVDLDFMANLGDLTPDKEYTMHIWAVSNNGQKSLVLTKQVKVCTGSVARAAFDFITSGSQVNFVDTVNAEFKSAWDFGDGKKDSISNPFHQYDSAGDFTVRQIVYNLCNSDTLIKIVSISGLKSIYSTSGGNKGAISVDIRGAGFATGVKVSLHKNGEQDIQGEALSIRSLGLLSATFNLTGKKKGLWDVTAIFPDGTKDTLFAAFTIADGTEPKLSVSISGSYVLRIGFNQIYNLTYSNTGNSDAGLVPLFVGGLPLGTDIEIKNPLFRLDNLPGIDTLNLPSYNISHTIHDSASNSSFRLFLIDKIPGGSTGTLQFIFHVPDTTQLHILPEIKVGLGKPLSELGPLPGNPNNGGNTGLDTLALLQDVSYCLEQAADIALEKTLEKALEGKDHDLSGIATCFSGTAAKQILKFFTSEETEKRGEESTYGKILDYTDLSLTVMTKVLGCTRVAGSAVAGVGSLLIQPEITIAAVFFNTRLLAAQQFLDKISTAVTTLKLLHDCEPIRKYDALDILKVIIGNAWDPNEKYGPGDASESHYTNTTSMNYVIGFENDPKANLNVQTITVTDTLKASYYDLKSFGFTSVTIGDSVFTLSSPQQSFFHDFDFIAQYGVKARVVATFDTAMGIAEWKFYTIDPATNQITREALDGFLPPDKVSPKGQGYVSFTVNRADTINTGKMVHNKAFIKFDYNPVIVTNDWQNVVDLVTPQSKVQQLPMEVNDTTFKVKWSGSDNLSGVYSYDVYVAVNNGPFSQWLTGVTVTEENFTGNWDSTYRFYSIATDNAGNVEAAKSQQETSTLVKAKITAVDDPQGNGFYFRQNYPNPVITTTWLEFELPVAQQVHIALRDIQGKEVSIVADNKLFTAGIHKLNMSMSNLASGIYIVEFNSKKFRKSIKVVKK